MIIMGAPQHIKHRKKRKVIKRGEIYYANMGNGIGSEQKGMRPVLILQNDTGNHFSPTTIVAIITSVNKKQNLPVHLQLPSHISGLPKDSTIMLEQIRTIDKNRIKEYISTLDKETLAEVESKLSFSLGMKCG